VGKFKKKHLFPSKILLSSALVGVQWSASRPYCSTPGEKAPGNLCIGGWAGLRADLDVWIYENS
jgi:hypothetical protein